MAKGKTELYLTDTNLNVLTITHGYNIKKLPSLDIIKKSILNLNLIDETFNFEVALNSEIVQIWDSNLSKLSPEALYLNLHSVKKLSLIDTVYPKDLNFSKFSKIEELEFNFNIPSDFRNCQRLRELIVRKVKNHNLDFKGLQKLEKLEIIQGKVNELIGLENCKKLKAITFYNCKFSSKIDFRLLNKLPQLEYIHFYNFHDEIDLEMLDKCSKLKCVILENITQVKDNEKRYKNKGYSFKILTIGKSNLTKERRLILKTGNEDCRYGYFLLNRCVDRLKEA